MVLLLSKIKTNPNPKSKKKNKSFPSNQNYQTFAPLSHVMAFSSVMVLHPATTTLLPFCSSKVLYCFFFFFFLFSIKSCFDFFKELMDHLNKNSAASTR